MTVRMSKYGSKVSQTESRTLAQARILSGGGESKNHPRMIVSSESSTDELPSTNSTVDEEKLKAAQEKVEALGQEYRLKMEKVRKLQKMGQEVHEQQIICQNENVRTLFVQKSHFPPMCY